MDSSFAAVITTIQEPTSCVLGLVNSLKQAGGALIAIGDQKGPARFDLPGSLPGICDFYSLARQRKLPFALASLLPIKHYAQEPRVFAGDQTGATQIYETDDDNMPASGWGPYRLEAEAQVVKPRLWMNVYRLFSDELIWPRGFPLDRVTDAATFEHDSSIAPRAGPCADPAGFSRLSSRCQRGVASGPRPQLQVPPRSQRLARTGHLVPVQ